MNTGKLHVKHIFSTWLWVIPPKTIHHWLHQYFKTIYILYMTSYTFEDIKMKTTYGNKWNVISLGATMFPTRRPKYLQESHEVVWSIKNRCIVAKLYFEDLEIYFLKTNSFLLKMGWKLSNQLSFWLFSKGVEYKTTIFCNI